MVGLTSVAVCTISRLRGPWRITAVLEVSRTTPVGRTLTPEQSVDQRALAALELTQHSQVEARCGIAADPPATRRRPSARGHRRRFITQAGRHDQEWVYEHGADEVLPRDVDFVELEPQRYMIDCVPPWLSAPLSTVAVWSPCDPPLIRREALIVSSPDPLRP
jgi:hypothetical protein